MVSFLTQENISCQSSEMVGSTLLPMFQRLHEVISQHLASMQSATATLKAQVGYIVNMFQVLNKDVCVYIGKRAVGKYFKVCG